MWLSELLICDFVYEGIPESATVSWCQRNRHVLHFSSSHCFVVVIIIFTILIFNTLGSIDSEAKSHKARVASPPCRHWQRNFRERSPSLSKHCIIIIFITHTNVNT